MRISKIWKFGGVATVIVAGAIMGCSGGPNPLGGGAGGNGQLTGQLTNESVPQVLAEFGRVYGAKDFVDSIENYLLRDTANSVSKARKAATQKKSSRKSGNKITPRVVVPGCPTVADDQGTGGPLSSVRTITLAYDGCTPPGATQPSRGAATIREEIFNVADDNTIINGNQEYTFASTEFGGKRYTGIVDHLLNQDPTSEGGTVDAEEIYEWKNLNIHTPDPFNPTVPGGVTYNGKYQLQYAHYPRDGKVDVEMSVDTDTDVQSESQWNMDLNFDSTATRGENGTFDVDARLSGTAKGTVTSFVFESPTDEEPKKKVGTYEFTLTNVMAKDACNSANNGSMVIKGANGEARVTFGPGCGKGHFSINGGPQVAFDAEAVESAVASATRRSRIKR